MKLLFRSKIVFLFSGILLTAVYSRVFGIQAPSTEKDRGDLIELLSQREKLFGQYSESLAKKSGFFGNRTKADLRLSQNRLQEIVEMDNRLIRVLNRIVDFKNFEKQNLSYEAAKNNESLDNLRSAVDTLSKQLRLKEQELYVLNQSDKALRIKYFFVLFLLPVLLILMYRKARRS
ncbi:MAG: hypothetical protein IT242_01100 [Bacteroidia bacterium]|nr:hypothetical protein [Bacteroidia bacterium]